MTCQFWYWKQDKVTFCGMGLSYGEPMSSSACSTITELKTFNITLSPAMNIVNKDDLLCNSNDSDEYKFHLYLHYWKIQTQMMTIQMMINQTLVFRISFMMMKSLLISVFFQAIFYIALNVLWQDYIHTNIWKLMMLMIMMAIINHFYSWDLENPIYM